MGRPLRALLAKLRSHTRLSLSSAELRRGRVSRGRGRCLRVYAYCSMQDVLEPLHPPAGDCGKQTPSSQVPVNLRPHCTADWSHCVAYGVTFVQVPSSLEYG